MNLIILTNLLIITIVIGQFNSDAAGAGIYDKTADFCAWLRQTYNYGCDGPVDNRVWREYKSARFGVTTDCNSFCTNYQRRSGGSCQPGSQGSQGTWCPNGQYCQCY